MFNAVERNGGNQRTFHFSAINVKKKKKKEKGPGNTRGNTRGNTHHRK